MATSRTRSPPPSCGSRPTRSSGGRTRIGPIPSAATADHVGRPARSTGGAMRRRPAPVALASLLLAALLLAAGCGGDRGGAGAAASGTAAPPTRRVPAASSLARAFTAYGRQFYDASARFSFAGSDELAAQIERGAKPDVFAAAGTR